MTRFPSPGSSPSGSDIAIQIRDMRVDYGDYVAVHGLNLDVPRGEVFGLIGPNGAGKTSSFKVLATLMRPTYGDVLLGGIDIAVYPESVRDILGYMPDMAGVPSDLKVWEFLELFAGAHGFDGDQATSRIDECLDVVALTEKRDAFCKELSRGMKQRLVFAKTLMHEPTVMILDEPASGMDPVSRAALRTAVKQLASRGTTVMVSSHILSELSDMCTSVGIMSEGNLVASGNIDEVVDKLGTQGKTVRLKFVEPVGDEHSCLATLRSDPLVTNLEMGDLVAEFSYLGSDAGQAELLKSLVLAGAPIRTFEEKLGNIEDVVVNLSMNGNGNGEDGKGTSGRKRR